MKVLPANRVAALATFIAGLAGCATSLAGVWPSSVTTEIALVAGSVAAISGPLAHVLGSILWDRTPAGQKGATGLTGAPRAGCACSVPVPEGMSTGEQHKHDPHMSVSHEADVGLAPHPVARDPELFKAGKCEPVQEADLATDGANFTAYDDVNTSLIPADATHVAYYCNGPFANLNSMRAHVPHALLSPTLLRQPVADFKQYVAWEHGVSVDIEPSLFTPAQAASIAKDMKAQGVMPKIYFPLSWAAQVVSALAAAGLKREDVQLHSAHWTGAAHVCSGIVTREWGVISADATQYTDKALGLSLDANLCKSTYYGPWGAPTPTPVPAPTPAPTPAPLKHAKGRRMLEVQYNANPPHGHNWALTGNKPVEWSNGDIDHWASAELQVNMKTGTARIRGEKFNAAPLGG